MALPEATRATTLPGGRPWALGLALCLTLTTTAHAQTRGIYTCVDAQGQRLSSDRPIPACLDREQQELNPSGTIKRHLPPEPTAAERAQQAERAREAAQARDRERRDALRDQALGLRYPQPASHDKARDAALASHQEAIRIGQQRLKTLAEQRTAAELDMEFYKADPNKAPAALKRQFVDIDRGVAAQHRFIADQEAETLEVRKRFDEERARLQKIWAKEPGNTPN